jgi:signal peptidase
MPRRARLLAVVLGCWLAAAPFLLVAQPAVVGADAGYAVGSDSMEPAIPRGSIVLVESVPPERIGVGDVITYRGELGIGPTTTHRVVAVNRSDGLAFRTKGDANPSADNELVAAERVVGRVTVVVPWVGYPVLVFGTVGPLLVLVVAPALGLGIASVRDLLAEVGADR